MDSKRLLIAAGCSFTEPTFYLEKNILPWPNIIADGAGFDLLNVGRGGAGQDYISNAVIDAVMENQDRDPIVMVLWSEFSRINLYDYCTKWVSTNNKLLDTIPKPPFENMNPHVGMTMSEKDAMIARNQFRIMWRTKKFVEDLGFEFYAKIGISSLYQIMQIADGGDREKRAIHYGMLRKNILKDFYFLNSGITMKELEEGLPKHPKKGDPQSFVDTGIFLECRHPNQAGHEIIADAFLEKYLKAHEPPVFIYD